MISILRITSELLSKAHQDLSRPHAFAFERVAFISCKVASLNGDGITLLAHSLHVVADEDYERSSTMGALISGQAFRKMLQYSYTNKVSIFHIHRHENYGRPIFSKIDIQESAKFVPDFFKVCPNQPHGAVVLSLDSIHGLIWDPRTKKSEPISKFVIVGNQIVEIGDDNI